MATELYQFRLEGTHTSEYWQMVHYFIGENLSAGDVIHNAKDLISNYINNLQSPLMDLLSQTTYLSRLTAKRQDVAGGIEVNKQYDYQAFQGTVSGACSSEQLCPVVRLIPPMGVKSAGRFFLPGIAEDDIEINIPVAGWVSRLSTYMSIALAGMNDGAITWTQAIYSRKLNQYHKALDYDTSPIIGWQSRRRKPF
jgi:hypothetical protein